MNRPLQGNGFVSLRSFLTLTFIDMVVVTACIFFWVWVWIDTKRLTVPDNRTPTAQSQLNNNQTRPARLPLETIQQTLSFLREVVSGFNQDYLIRNLGLDAFLYLAFVRCLVKISGILCLLNFCICIPYICFFEDPDRVSLIRVRSHGNVSFRTTYSILVSVIVLYILVSFKRMAQLRVRNTILNHPKECAFTTWLKLRTVFVQFQQESTIKPQPQQIRNYLQRFLSVDCQDRSVVYDIIPIFNYGKILSRQYDIEYYKILDNLPQKNRPWLWKCFKVNNTESLDSKIAKAYKQIQEIKAENYKKIVGAFVVVSSGEAVKHLTQQFHAASQYKCCREGDIFDSQENDKLDILVESSSWPRDIVWANMKYYKISVFREALINAVCIIILLFISTPSTVLNLIELPPVLSTVSLVLTNVLLIYILSLTVRNEDGVWRSEKEISQFTVLLIYLSINTVLVSIARGINNLSDFLMDDGGWHWVEVFELVYTKVDGYFFCLIFINQTVVCFLMSCVKPRELINSFGSPRLYLDKRPVFLKTMYGKHYNFQFGTNYAFLVTLFIISIIYTSSIPILHVFSLLFFVSRLYLDTYTLLTFHQEETVSMGKLTNKVLLGAGIGVVTQLFLVANSFLIQSKYINSITLYIVLIGALYVCNYLNKPLVCLTDLCDKNTYMEANLRREHILKWKQLYSYPLNF